jgi:hypothetical protein
VETRHLSYEEFKATFADKMLPPPEADEPPVDFWRYFDAIPAEDFENYDCSEGRVENVWRGSDRRFEHVLINSDDPNVFMVIVLDLKALTVYGHRLLNLYDEYGLDAPERGVQTEERRPTG